MREGIVPSVPLSKSNRENGSIIVYVLHIPRTYTLTVFHLRETEVRHALIDRTQVTRIISSRHKI